MVHEYGHKCYTWCIASVTLCHLLAMDTFLRPGMRKQKERTEQGWKGLLFDRLKAMLGGSVMG